MVKSEPTSAEWVFRTVTSQNWADMDALFDGKGGPRHCWCMMWRSDADGNAAKTDPDARRAAMERLVMSGTQIGLLGYDKGLPVAWCSIAPRSLFGKSLSGTASDPDLWSLTCFFIRASHRKQAGFAALIAAAELYAASHGGREIEAYPVDPDSPSYRFGGFLPSFEKCGYAAIARVGSRRHVVRKRLAI